MSKLPKPGDIVKTPDGLGAVLRLSVDGAMAEVATVKWTRPMKRRDLVVVRKK